DVLGDAAGLGQRLAADGQSELDRLGHAAPLRWRQQLARLQDNCVPAITCRIGEACATRNPVGQARTDQPDALDMQFHAARPRTRLQLLPPKPKELLMTRSMRAAPPSTR